MNEIDLNTKKLLDKMRGDGGIPINKDSLIRNYCEVEFKDSLDECPTQEKRDALMDRYVEHYSTGDGSAFMDTTIAKIKDYAKKASDGVKEMTTSASKIMASNAVPSVITTGSAASVPNPAHFAIENAQKKNALLALAKSVIGTLTLLLETAILVHWAVPNEILTIIQGVTALTAILNNIPG